GLPGGLKVAGGLAVGVDEVRRGLLPAAGATGPEGALAVAERRDATGGADGGEPAHRVGGAHGVPPGFRWCGVVSIAEPSPARPGAATRRAAGEKKPPRNKRSASGARGGLFGGAGPRSGLVRTAWPAMMERRNDPIAVRAARP